MQRKVMISCAVTGSAEQLGCLHLGFQQMKSCLDHTDVGIRCSERGIFLGDPKSTKPSMDGALYREVVERIKASGTDVLINLTTGPGARFMHDPDDPQSRAPTAH
jgi:uncharacterized protein (DUF849 family)